MSRIHPLAPASGGKRFASPVGGGNERSPPLAGVGGWKMKYSHNLLKISPIRSLTERLCPLAPASGGKRATSPAIGGKKRSPPLAGAGGWKTKIPP